MKIIFLGAPGSGKGTHATRVKTELGVPHISTGDIFRENIKGGTPLGVLAKSYIDKGALVPDDVVIKIVEDRLAREDCQKGFILDGFPRTIYQAEALKKIAKIDVVINLVVDDEAIVKRVAGRRMCRCGETYNVAFLNGSDTCAKCGGKLYQRDDDKEETVKSRLDVYHKETAPLIDYYRKEGLLKDVDGSQGIEAVYADILKVLK
ncbi:MAG TPA: adenylate kinase [Clostridiales bacterium]|nr:adenylate kinase [Clostridiales bacterium]